MPPIRSLVPSFTTPDLPRCLAFYRDQLGFAVTSSIGDDANLTWLELTHGSVRLMLLAAEPDGTEETGNLAAPDRVGGPQRGASSDGRQFSAAGVIFYFEIDAVREAQAALRGAGCDVSDVEVTFYGMRECYLKDPDGRQLTLAEPSGPEETVTVTEL